MHLEDMAAWIRAEVGAFKGRPGRGNPYSEACVIGSTRRVVVFAYREPVDMRKAFDALTALVVQGLDRDVMSGEMFLFVNRTQSGVR